VKILHLIYDHINNPWLGGGGAVRVYEIYRRLNNRGYEVNIVCGSFPGAQDYRERNIRFKFVGFNGNYIISTLSYAYFAYRFLRKNWKAFDFIIEDFAPWNPVFSHRFQNMKPVVLQLHHMMGIKIVRKYYVFGLPFYLIENLYPKRFRNIVSVSEETLRKYEVDGYVIPNGINFLIDAKDIKIGDYILYLGRIEFYNKGLDLLLDANLGLKTIIVGKGKDERLLKGLKREYQFLGFVDEKMKRSLIENSRFLVMPSRYEGQGIVALEAAAMGKPVVVSDIPELRYVVENGFGISFRSKNVDDLKEKIENLWKDESLILEMGKRGVEFARSYTWDEMAVKYEQYLRETKQRCA